MAAVVDACRGYLHSLADGWNRFWFTPAEPQTLAIIRILAGAMLLYTHIVWALDLDAFLGPDSWVTADVARALHGPSAAWSYLWYIQSPLLLWTLHILALVVFAMLMFGLASRVVSVLAWLITIAYCHRLIGTLFGLDQINAMLAMYLMVGDSGGAYSLDRLLRRRRTGMLAAPQARVDTNLAIRLIQLHMCIIYLFSGLAKMEGQAWRDGGAVWLAVANLEYQSLDLTWLVHYPVLIALLTHVTVFWETFYCVLIWPRWTRPTMLALAVAVHGGIAIGLGMITFGLVMLIGNLAFVPPSLTAMIVSGISRRRSGAGERARTKGGKRKDEG